MMSLDEFLVMQEQREIAKRERAKDQAPRVDVDKHLAPYRLGHNDVLEVSLAGLEGETATSIYRARVDRRGEIDLPIVGAIKVGGMEIADAEDAVKNAYVPGIVRAMSVNIAVLDYDLANVVVTGAATTPGLVPLRRSERNLLYAVANAGGVSNEASGRVTLSRVRNPGQHLTFDLRDPIGVAEALNAGPLQNGDIVEVQPAMPNVVFVGGLVNRPGAQVFPNGVPYTLLQVLASASGLRTDILPNEGYLVRRMPDGSDVRVKLNLDRIQSGEDENIVMAPGDILWVPHTVGTRVHEFINRNVFVRAGYSLIYTSEGMHYLNSAARDRYDYGGLEDSFDPFGFLTRGAGIQSLSAAPPAQ